MIILTILVYFLLFLLGLLLLTLIVPIDYDLSASKYENMTFKGKIGWLWRLIQVDFTMISTDPKTLHMKIIGLHFSIDLSQKERHKKKKQPEKPKEKKTKSKGSFPLSKEHFSKELLDVMLSTINKIIKRLKPKKFSLKGVYGFHDPYYTGIVLAIISTLRPLSKGSNIELTPSFFETKLEGEVEIEGRMVGIVFLTIILRLILSKPIRNIIKTLFKKKKEEKSYVS